MRTALGRWGTASFLKGWCKYVHQTHLSCLELHGLVSSIRQFTTQLQSLFWRFLSEADQQCPVASANHQDLRDFIFSHFHNVMIKVVAACACMCEGLLDYSSPSLGPLESIGTKCRLVLDGRVR